MNAIRRTPSKAIGPRLRIVLVLLLASFVLLAVNSAYLGGVSIMEWRTGLTYQNYAYQLMFLFHLTVGLLTVVPSLIFMLIHSRNTWRRKNRSAVYAGLGLMTAVLALLVSGIVLVRFEGFELHHPTSRSIAYWTHVLMPLVCVWLFILHRLAGPRIRWRFGGAVTILGGMFAVGLIALQMQDPRQWNQAGRAGSADFTPALARSATGKTIPSDVLMRDQYCASCHADAHDRWQYSAHRFASFNNPVYLFAVRNTRKTMIERDGNVRGARFCAGCHDLVPLLSGAFDDPNFDDVNHPTAQAGITCSACHAITHVNSVRGNGDFTIEEPIHYPFAFSDSPVLAWLSRNLIRANPDFHKRTFLKPLHKQPEFCSTCHKVNLPEDLNAYRWLRGQNHYDSFLLSGVSGHSVTSFYYPPKAQKSCNGCHLPLRKSDDVAARDFDDSGITSVHDHLFPAANTGIAKILGMPEDIVASHQEMLRKSVRIDIFALREGGRIDGNLIGPIRPSLPTLQPGKTYLLETVIRAMGVGHTFTQGTADSNEVWVEIEVEQDGKLIGHSGGLDASTGEVDPYAHFINAFVLDREGRRIDRRNAEDIFAPLYDHQIPPGAAALLHYRLRVPEGAMAPITVRARVLYRKFDTTLMRLVDADAFRRNDLPITLLSEDSVQLEIATGVPLRTLPPDRDIPEWERWNDYGIGALLAPQRRQLRQAEQAFARVEALGKSVGALNLARVYIDEGRLDEAATALQRARQHTEPPYPWSLAWFTGLLLKQEGEFELALSSFQALAKTEFQEARARGFDFSRDYRLLAELGLTWMEIAKLHQGAEPNDKHRTALMEARRWFTLALEGDPERASTHYNLALLSAQLGDTDKAAEHTALHERYRLNENALDRAISAARKRYPAARVAADPVSIYDLHRDGWELHNERFMQKTTEPQVEP